MWGPSSAYSISQKPKCGHPAVCHDSCSGLGMLRLAVCTTVVCATGRKQHGRGGSQAFSACDCFVGELANVWAIVCAVYL